ncbi:Uncharacterised protein [Rhodococcus rhodochrous]|uniref:hypothetical protein n=1 Tax=Rhodococcus rhodochrous TaxID=1829 RepID=UPI000AD9A2FC|nr:hypothetical protein [Rhodococcus rhodochrous]MDO1486951.1 hypothetical protein [Rhodococcus rhodochrous]SNV27858.1 Uncharacterised protein [Rhodococcus rhodochrous]
MIERQTGTAATSTEFLHVLLDRMAPDGAWAAVAGTVEAVEIVIEAARSTVLEPARRLAAEEAIDPRFEPGSGHQWPDTEGFYLAAIAVRFAQLLDSCEAVTSLHRSGHHRAGWAVLDQSADTLTRLWMLTETMVFDQPRDEARRSSHAWYAFAQAYNRCGLGAPVAVHPFDAALGDDVTEDEDVSLAAGRHRAPMHARDLVAAITEGVRLAQVYIPGALQLDPAAIAELPSAAAGFDNARLAQSQLHLTAGLVYSAAVSVDAAFRISIGHR